MATVTLEEAQIHLKELIERHRAGDEIVIVHDQKPVARLVIGATTERPPRKLGTLKGTVLSMAPDFDAPLEEFKEYME